jgi:RNA polymerase sigma-70 factor (ECF subfamily)
MDDDMERALIARAREEPEAFGELYRRYVDRIYNYHYRHTSNRVEAEDLTSRTFFKALRHLPRYRDKKGASFQSWLFRIAHNLVVNWYRDKSRHPEVSVDLLDPLPTESGNPHRAVEKLEEQEGLLKLIDALPEDRKTLVILKFVERMTNAEIGAVLGKTEGAVKALYYRTLVSLRGEVGEGESL